MNKDNYYDNYQVLKSIGEKMRLGGPADIDSLVENFREARTAYSACRERLLAIKDEIEAEIASVSPADGGESDGTSVAG